MLYSFQQESIVLWVAMALWPARVIMHTEIGLASQDHQLHVWKGAINFDEGEGAGTSVRAVLGNGRHGLLEAARMVLDDNALAAWRALHAPRNFDGFPAAAFTLEFRHDVFRTLSRSSAYTYKYCKRRHMMPDYQVYRLLDRSITVDALLAIGCSAMRGSYLRGFIADFGKPYLTSFPALIELAVVVLTGKTSTIKIENLNAFLRRSLALRFHARRMSLLQLSVMFLLAGMRNRERFRIIA